MCSMVNMLDDTTADVKAAFSPRIDVRPLAATIAGRLR